MELNKTPMREQDPKIRANNFLEVALGYSKEEAIKEAQRCLNCKKPLCVQGCPVNVNIPGFISELVKGDMEKSISVLRDTNNLPAICGRVCPQETQCESLCIVGRKGDPVSIGKLERFVADYALENEEIDTEIKECTGPMAAVIGAGPGGLAAAADLAKANFRVTLFEAFHKPGGVLVYGIPEFRLPKDIVEKEIEKLKYLGVNIQLNTIIGKSLTLEDLKDDGYKYIFIGSGAGLPKFLNIDGENLNGVFSANEYLTRINLMKAYDFPNNHTPIKRAKSVAVVGGGNVAMDAARCAIRMGTEKVYIIYRRTFDEMPARLEEVHHAQEEGIIFKNLNNPTEIIGENGQVKAIKVIKMELGEADESGRRRPIPIKDSEYEIPVDIVIMAIGTNPNPMIPRSTKELKTSKRGQITANESGLTNLENVYAGGDAVTGAATVIMAMGAGKKAAKAIIEKEEMKNNE